ncbi:F0F1 ATP synthase subunit B [Fulvivirga kasyanovii]|uniref:ATP synthase subunit b n=1 Tax=Fulvivirga kasyanovii TaxID=396812 RepID=A0ABW9RPC8_9BACT|nr:F0F1 ATP synthase subunit B [Fulvivirga kasyanovii]MTI25556.1 F0F1 ATP synthase subunit B [Fulvivirga kasyanovii]
MDQLLNDFSPGLFFMQAFIFLILLFLLAKFAWKPIIQSLKIREESIQDALDSAERAKEEMAQLKADNEKLLDEARQQRDTILQDAREVANGIREEAKADATKQTDKMIADARAAIEVEKQAAMAEVRTLVAELSLQVAEKLLKRKLDDEGAQKELISDFIKDVKLN